MRPYLSLLAGSDFYSIADHAYSARSQGTSVVEVMTNVYTFLPQEKLAPLTSTTTALRDTSPGVEDRID